MYSHHILFVLTMMFAVLSTNAQDVTVATHWNEEVLEGIRNDFARPTVHARNLLHSSIIMYDAWAAYDNTSSETYFLGKTIHDYICEFDESNFSIPETPEEVKVAQETALSYAVYRFMKHRYGNSPQADATMSNINARMMEMELDTLIESTDYINDGPAALGNYLAEQIIAYGMQDGANEIADYANLCYESVNPNILPEESIVLTDGELKAENYFLIEKKSNIEKKISNLFEINKSSARKRELERITQNRIYQTPRFRKDVKKIIIDTKEISAERIIPAINFNLIFEPEIYILPGQLDLWRFSKKEFNSNLKGLEHPIFLNDNFLFDDEFSKKQIQEKLFYALGFDSLLFLGKGINTRFNGLLGKYTKDENRIFITPEKIGFQ